MEIRKLSDPPKAEAIRDMIRYARNVIEEFRRAKHYKYILYNCAGSLLSLADERWQEVGKREQEGGVCLKFWILKEACLLVNV